MARYLVQRILATGFLALFSYIASAQWIQANGPSGWKVHALGANGTAIFAGTYHEGVFRSTDNCSTWTAVNKGIPDSVPVKVFAVGGKNIFAGTENGIFRSADNGDSWTKVSSGLITNTLSLAVSKNKIFAGPGNNHFGIYCSTGDTSWSEIGRFTNYWVFSLAAIGSTIFAGTSEKGVFRSTDNGASWTDVSSGLPAYAAINCLAIDGNNIFAGSDAGAIFLSANNGKSWTKVNPVLTRTNVQCFAVSGSHVFVGTDGGGVLHSANNGISLTEMNSGLTDLRIFSLVVIGNNVFAGTWGDGVWRCRY